MAKASVDTNKDTKLKYNHKKCDYTFYKDSEHVKQVQDGDLGSVGEFCGAFYHVPKRRKFDMVCLDPNTCQVKETGKPFAQPKTAVALVKFESKGEVRFQQRYTNCYTHKAHAEEFFYEHITKDNLIARSNIDLITMYITMQPCHESTTDTWGTPDGYSCCKFLEKLTKKLPSDVEIWIKPTHLCQAGWRISKDETKKKFNKNITNAEEGLKNLMRTDRIKFLSMEPSDWAYLWQFVNVPKDLKLEVGKERMALDSYIEEKLENWEIEVKNKAAAKDVDEDVDEVAENLETLDLKPTRKRGKGKKGSV